jgi:hypothetical protein
MTSPNPFNKKDTEIRTPSQELTWCFAHKRWEREDDPIDFGVSDDWLDFYHRQGLTPRRSQKYFAPSVREGISDDLERIRSVLERLLAELSVPPGDGRKGPAMTLLSENRRLREENARLRARLEAPEKGERGKGGEEGEGGKRRGKPV